MGNTGQGKPIIFELLKHYFHDFIFEILLEIALKCSDVFVNRSKIKQLFAISIMFNGLNNLHLSFIEGINIGHWIVNLSLKCGYKFIPNFFELTLPFLSSNFFDESFPGLCEIHIDYNRWRVNNKCWNDCK